MFFHTFFTFCQAEKSSFRRKNTRVVTAFLKGEKRHGSAIADGSQRQPCEDGTARRLHGRRRPYEGGAGGKAWRESAPFRQPGTAQMWPCGRGRRQSRPYGRGRRQSRPYGGAFARGAFRRSQNAAWPAAWYLLFSGAARGGSARRALFAAGAVSGARCMGSDRLPPGRVQKAGHRENSRRPAKQKP